MSYYDPQTRDLSQSRRPQNRRDDAWICALLSRLTICRISTVWVDQAGLAFPFIHPTSFVYRPESHDLIFHSNVVGRLRANVEEAKLEAGQRMSFEASEMGRFLPSNDPLELSVQYRSVMAYGPARLLEGEAARQALTALCAHVFPPLRMGAELQPISDEALRRTSVYALAVERWSGKENWSPQATQAPDWPALSAEWLQGAENEEPPRSPGDQKLGEI